jgi:predicted nucleic acid-binding Zn ribbon protein
MTDADADAGEVGPVEDRSEQPTKLSGIDLVRRTLEEARATARAQGKDAGRGRATPVSGRRVAGRRRSWSGPGPDIRDPQPLGRIAQDVAKKRGWSAHVAEGTVLGHWPLVVGQDIADHATPTALNEGVLSVTAESTAWATQLRMVQAQLLAKIAAAVGNGVVTSLKITGPAAPSWRKGPRHISGRGPRDTYG